MKKSLLVLAVLLLTVSMLFANGQQGSSSAAAGGKTYENIGPVSAADPIDVAKFPYSVAEPMTITFFDVAANKMGDQTGWFGDIIKRRFNVNLNIIAPQTQGNTLYQTRASAGYLGDLIILDPADFQESIDAGLIDDLTDEVNASTYLKQNLPQYKYWNGKLTGNSAVKIYGFPTEITNTGVDAFSATAADNAPKIPWDYYKGVGSPTMKDENDLLNVIKQIVDKYPTNAAGDKTYGVELWPDWDGTNGYLEPAMQSMQWYGWFTDPAYNSVQYKFDSTITDLLDENGGYLRSLRFYNKANQMGLLDPDAATQTWEGGMMPKLTSKQVVLITYGWQAGWTNSITKDKAGENYMYIPVDNLTFYQPGDSYYGTLRVFGVGTENGKELAPAKKERVMALLDWLTSPECLAFQHSGLPTVAGIEGSYTQKAGSDGKMKNTLTSWGIDASAGNLPTPQAWGGAGYQDGQSMINQWMMHSVSINPNTNEPYASQYWASTLAEAQASTTTKEWMTKYGYPNEVKYMIAKGQMKPVPYVRPVFPIDATTISNIRGQTAMQVKDASWKMVFAKSDAEFNQLLASLKTTLAGLGWADLVKNDTAKAKMVTDGWAAARK
ncbi:MAG: hypothetical protein LBM77_04520 [Spirochaetaceae bacterium]|jgi:multiple sugar transport system substrate-binding protein/putative aldouronate transport system substrate-binding protein|nr:hypothetical protein [Spirochaetaceae bacterium]